MEPTRGSLSRKIVFQDPSVKFHASGQEDGLHLVLLANHMLRSAGGGVCMRKADASKTACNSAACVIAVMFLLGGQSAPVTLLVSICALEEGAREIRHMLFFLRAEVQGPPEGPLKHFELQ